MCSMTSRRRKVCPNRRSEEFQAADLPLVSQPEAAELLNVSERLLLKFVLSLNATRRHLNASQRAMVAAKLANICHGGDRGGNQYGEWQAADLPDAISQPETPSFLTSANGCCGQPRQAMPEGHLSSGQLAASGANLATMKVGGGHSAKLQNGDPVSPRPTPRSNPTLQCGNRQFPAA